MKNDYLLAKIGADPAERALAVLQDLHGLLVRPRNPRQKRRAVLELLDEVQLARYGDDMGSHIGVESMSNRL